MPRRKTEFRKFGGFSPQEMFGSSMKMCMGTADKGWEGQAPKYRSVKQEMFFKKYSVGQLPWKTNIFQI